MVVAEFRVVDKERCRSTNLADPRIVLSAADDDDDLASVSGPFQGSHSFANWLLVRVGGNDLRNLPGFNKEGCSASFWLDADVLAAYSDLEEATFEANYKDDLAWGACCSCHGHELSDLGFRFS